MLFWSNWRFSDFLKTFGISEVDGNDSENLQKRGCAALSAQTNLLSLKAGEARPDEINLMRHVLSACFGKEISDKMGAGECPLRDLCEQECLIHRNYVDKDDEKRT